MKDRTIVIITICIFLAAVPTMIWAHRYDERKKVQELQQRQERWRQDSIEQARYMDSTEKEMQRHIDSIVKDFFDHLHKARQ